MKMVPKNVLFLSLYLSHIRKKIMSNRIALWILVAVAPVFAFAQQPVGMCGTSIEDQAIIKQRMMENRAYYESHNLPRTGAKKYIPVRYHLYAKADGTGRLAPRACFENLCAINKLYADQEIEFYIKDIKFTNNEAVYNDPSSTVSASILAATAGGTNRNAINIFVASKANGAVPGVLAFYSPSGDYIVSDFRYVNSNGTTLAHEIGHFFSLAHTFYGWECGDFSVNAPPVQACYNILVEYVDRTKLYTNGKLHCNISADGFCDTPADYNLGFGWSGGCSWSGTVKDRDGAALDPDERNMMSYFLNCLATFSGEQKAAIDKDYNSVQRAFLRTPAYLEKPEVTDAVNYIAPVKSEIASGYDKVKFDWDPVPNATAYLFEVAELANFVTGLNYYIVRGTDTTLTNLKASKKYYWRVFPYNPNSFCNTTTTQTFSTPSFKVANHDLPEEVKSAQVLYSDSQDYLSIELSEYKKAQIQILNVHGQLISQKEVELGIGQNLTELNIQVPGLYFYSIKSGAEYLASGKYLKK